MTDPNAWIAPVGTTVDGVALTPGEKWFPLGRITPADSGRGPWVFGDIVDEAPYFAATGELFEFGQTHSITVSGIVQNSLYQLMMRLLYGSFPPPTFLPGEPYVQPVEPLGLARKCEHWRDWVFPTIMFSAIVRDGTAWWSTGDRRSPWWSTVQARRA